MIEANSQVGAVTSPDAGVPLVVLIGRPNAGKSSLFNRLTGGDAHVGNFPGITVDILEADVSLENGEKAVVVDLPGIYSLEATVDPQTDEGVARSFLEKALASGRRVALVQVVDATQLALGLRLTRELLRLPAPLIVVATQQDALERQGRSIRAELLAQALGVPVLTVSAREESTRARVLLEAVAAIDRPPPSKRTANLEYTAIDALIGRVLVDHGASSPRIRARRTMTSRADAVLLSHPLGALLFLLIMAGVFSAVFVVADPVSSFLERALGLLSGVIRGRLGASLTTSFITDGILGGTGTVLAFLPQIVILTVALEVLDASGYLARGAFIADRALRVLGLSGRSFVPLLVGHACAVPAVAATRVIRNPRERLVTMLIVPLMTCSARIPTYALVIAAFFPGVGAAGKAVIFVSLYLLGILAGLLVSLVLGRSVVRGKSLPLVMEMPSYRWPQPRLVARKGFRAAVAFVRAAGTGILIASAVLWLLLHIPLPGTRLLESDTPKTRIESSVAAGIGRALEPVTRPLGFDWRINVGLIGAFGAREIMVGTLGVIHGVEATDDTGPLSTKIREVRGPDQRPAYSIRTALALLAFFVVACQCMSTVVAIGRETKSLKWPLFVVGYTYTLGYALAWVTSAVAGRFGL